MNRLRCPTPHTRTPNTRTPNIDIPNIDIPNSRWTRLAGEEDQ